MAKMATAFGALVTLTPAPATVRLLNRERTQGRGGKGFRSCSKADPRGRAKKPAVLSRGHVKNPTGLEISEGNRVMR
jgi:hypothetical protein